MATPVASTSENIDAMREQIAKLLNENPPRKREAKIIGRNMHVLMAFRDRREQREKQS